MLKPQVKRYTRPAGKTAKKKQPMPMVKVMGHTVRKGTKKWAALTQQKRLFDQIPQVER